MIKRDGAQAPPPPALHLAWQGFRYFKKTENQFNSPTLLTHVTQINIPESA
jgi:hypothetical protein